MRSSLESLEAAALALPEHDRAALAHRLIASLDGTDDDDPMDREIVSSRVFPAPREIVFRAFSDPEVLGKWWGPKGFTNTFHEFDFRPGGAWRFVMHGPDGAEFQMEKRFVEIVPPERISLRHEQSTHGFLMTMDFAAEGEGTRLTWTMRFDSVEEAERVRAAIITANEENFDRLAAQLAAGRGAG